MGGKAKDLVSVPAAASQGTVRELPPRPRRVLSGSLSGAMGIVPAQVPQGIPASELSSRKEERNVFLDRSCLLVPIG